MTTKKSLKSNLQISRKSSQSSKTKRPSSLNKLIEKKKRSKLSKKLSKKPRSFIKSLSKSKCKKGSKSKIKKIDFNIVLDLDNTIISSFSKEEYDELKIDHKNKFKSILNGMYYTMERPYLNEFLDYLFSHFHVSVWTAASKSYAKQIIDTFILRGKKNRKLRSFLHYDHCKESMDNINPKTMKDLKYLFIVKDKMFNQNNTVIIDDLKEVLNNNKKNSIDSEYFDGSKKNSPNDTFLLQLMKDLDTFYQTLCSNKNYN